MCWVCFIDHNPATIQKRDSDHKSDAKSAAHDAATKEHPRSRRRSTEPADAADVGAAADGTESVGASGYDEQYDVCARFVTALMDVAIDVDLNTTTSALQLEVMNVLLALCSTQMYGPLSVDQYENTFIDRLMLTSSTYERMCAIACFVLF